MLEKYFHLAYNFVEANKRLVFTLVGIVNVVAVAGLFFIKFDNNVEVMLPANREISQSITFIKDSNLSNKIVISLSLTSEARNKEDLSVAVDQLAVSLTTPFFTDVTYGMSEYEMKEGMDFFVDKIPQILTAKDLDYIDTLINPQNISLNLKKIYRQMLAPGGIFINSMIRSDPLWLKNIVFDKLKTLSTSMGYNIKMENGHFISKDEKHAMIVAKTPVLVTDMVESKKLFSVLEKQFQQLPDYISAKIISGHSHTLSNTKIMRRDILICSIITSIAFIALFFIILRDVRAISIFLVPLSSVILSINLSYLFFGRFSYLVVGLGSVLAGICVDHVIHVYVSVRKGKDPLESIKHVLAPIFAGTITTIAIFIAFFFRTSEDIIS